MKFSVRDLFLVTLIAALAVAWWVDRNQLSLRLRETLLQCAEEKRIYESEIRNLKYEQRKHYWGEGPLSNPSASAPNPPKP
jgi:hypothetical protein